MITLPELEGLAEDQLLRHVLAVSVDMVFVKNRDCRLVWANRAYCDFHGMSLGQLRGLAGASLDKGDVPRCLVDDARVLQNGETVETDEEPLRDFNQRTRWFHTVKTPVFGPHGRPTLLVGISRDVTDNRANRLSLTRINECLLAFTSDSYKNINQLTALCGELLGAEYAVYNRLEKEFLTSVGQWNAPSDFDPINPLEGSLCAEVVKRGADAPVVKHDIEQRENPECASTYIGRAVKSGDQVLGSLFVIFHRDVEADAALSKVMGILASAIAVEEDRLRGEKIRERLSWELSQANKMGSIGRLAGGIAHDFNNILSTIKGYTEILDSSLKDPGQKADLGEISKSSDIAASLSRRLLAFERHEMAIPCVVALDETLTEMGRILKRLIGASIELVIEAEPAHVFVDPGHLEQIIINLAVNARDAMPEGGRLAFKLRQVDASKLPNEGVSAPTGRYVELEASDTGVGMSPETMSHIFEPFYSTKAPGKGTGLGLATIMDIVTKTRGRIACESAPGKGSTFRVFLPLCPKPMVPTTKSPLPSATSKPVSILLVEDDKDIRLLYARVLRSVGYQVVEASDGVEGLLRASDMGSRLHTLITDIILPGMNGHQLASTLAKSHPNLKVLFMSGYTNEMVFRNVMKPGVAFLQKPFNPSDLCRKLEEIITA
ncbi:MAG: ATP-binding protein [Elusimicrobiota bacterium]